MFSPPARSLFSIVLHLSRGKYRLETLRLGRELNPDVVFSGQMFQVFGCYTHKKKGEPAHPMQDKRWTVRLLWWCSPQWVWWCEMSVPDIRRNMGYQVSRSPFCFGPVPWRRHFIAGYNHPDMEVSQQGMLPASGRKLWGKKHKSWKWVFTIKNYAKVQCSSLMVESKTFEVFSNYMILF